MHVQFCRLCLAVRTMVRAGSSWRKPDQVRRCDPCPGVARFRTRHGLRFRPRAAVSALASGRRGPTQGEGPYHPTLGDAPAAPALIAWGKGILLLTLLRRASGP